jgi:hypothetical protein
MPVIIDGTTGITSPALDLTTPLPAADGGTGLSSAGTAGNVLTSNGTSWTSAAAAAFDAGTRIGFQQTTAPTGWTKDTTAGLNNSSMRIVTGSASSGGSVDFTTAFASQTPTGSVTITSVTGTAGATTLTTPQIPSHSHTAGTSDGASPASTRFANGNASPVATRSTNAEGGGGSHDHPFSFSSGAGTFSGSAINLAVKYYDFIIASKN